MASPHLKKDQSTKDRVCHFMKMAILQIVTLIRYYIDSLIDAIFGFYYNPQHRPIRPAKDPIVLQSATALAQKIRKRELTSEQVVTAFIDRIKDVNGLLNAVVDERFRDAIKEAQNIDRDIREGNIRDVDFQDKPFLGVPFTTKESTACKGLSFTFGLVKRTGCKAQFDADVIEKMKEAGAILIAVTNVPQLNLWQETRNPVYGLTNNPYDNTRNCGGSSGGEASILAACGSPLGIGTDIGGSIRIPAFMCGVFGHKPSQKLVSTHGLTFRTGREEDTMVAAGPMTRHAEDLIPCLKVLLGNNISKLHLNESVNVRNLKIYYCSDPKDPFVSQIGSEMSNVFDKCVRHFEEICEDPPTSVFFKQFKVGGKLWRHGMTQEPNADLNRDLANREGRLSSWRELYNFVMGKSEYNIAVMFNLINGLLPKEKPEWAEEQIKLLRFKLTNLLGTNGVLLYPSAPWPASYHHTAILRPWNFNLFAIWNALKLPATQVPLGLNKEGLPLGIQVIAAENQDHLALAVASHLEKTFGGYVPPFKVKINKED